MYKMILKQLWNERKGNLFIWLEMLVVSIFLWYAADALFVMYRLYSQPLGFNIEHTYHVSFDVIPEESPDYDTTSVHSERGGGDYLTLMDRIRRNPSVESICFTTGVHFHYRGSNQYATFRKDSLIRNGFVRYVSPTYFEVFDVKTAQGGSPSELVDALRDNQVVVTGTVADSFFGDLAAAVRQEIYITDQGSRDSVAYRIGGVCEKQRYCEFTGYDYAYYKLVDENKVAEEGDWVGEGLNTFIRVKPGADGAAFAADFRKEMEQQLRVGNIYLKDVFPMSHYRDQFLERWLDQVRQSLVHRLRGGERGAGAEHRAYRGAYRAASRRGGGRALVLFAALYRLEHRQQSLERLDQPAGAGNDRLAGVFPGVRHPLRYGRKPGETGADPVGASGGEGDDPLRRSGEQAIRPYRRDRGRDL